MATRQDRVSSLETKVDQYSQAIGELRGLIIALDRRFDASTTGCRPSIRDSRALISGLTPSIGGSTG
jgi:hypothetical protein